MAASFLSSNYGLVMFASEATYGVDQIDIDLNANTAVVYQCVTDCNIDEAATILRPACVRATHDNSEHVVIKNGANVTMTGYLTGKTSAAGDPPEYSPVLLASNLDETINVATSAVYNTATIRQSGMTVVKHEFGLDGTESRMIFTTGVQGGVTLNFAANEFATWTFNGVGTSFNVPTDDAQFFEATTGKPLLDNGAGSITYSGSYGYSAKTPMVCKLMTATMGGTTYNVAGISLNIGYATGTLDTVNGATTYSQVFNTRGDDAPPSGSVTMVSSGTDYDDVLSKWPASTAAAMQFVITDGTDTITIDLPNVQLGKPGRGDSNGVRTHEIPFFAAVNSTAGNDSVTITYT